LIIWLGWLPGVLASLLSSVGPVHPPLNLTVGSRQRPALGDWLIASPLLTPFRVSFFLLPTFDLEKRRSFLGRKSSVIAVFVLA
jgi:hypothetical protein